MKRLFFNTILASALLASATMYTSCGDDDDDDDNKSTNEQPANNEESTNDGGTTNGGTTDGGTTNGGTTNGGTTNGGTTNGENTTTAADFTSVESLNGSDYYVICLNSLAYDYLEANGKIAGDLRIDDTNTAFYLWDNTCSAGTLSGNDFFGNDSNGGISVKSAQQTTWTGFGWCRLTGFDFSKIDETYTLHFAIRGNKSDAESYIAFGDPGLTGKEFKPASNNAITDLNGKTFSTDTKGEWVEYEYSVGDMIDAGIYFINYTPGVDKDGNPALDDKGNKKAINFPAIGGFTGGEIDLDAIFIYKKN